MHNRKAVNHIIGSRPPSPSPPPVLARVRPRRLTPCSLGVTSRTFFGETIPDGAPPEEPLVGGLPLPPEAVVPSIPRTFSTALLSALAHGSRLTKPTPALRPAESRRLDSSSTVARFCSRRGPGPQSCMQPGVAQPPSLIETSPSQVVMQAICPPCPQPWHQVQRADPLGRGAVKQSMYAPSKFCSSEAGMGSVRAEE